MKFSVFNIYSRVKHLHNVYFLYRIEHKKLQKLVPATDDVETPNIIHRQAQQKADKQVHSGQIPHYMSMNMLG